MGTAINAFEGLIRKSDKITDGLYRVTTARRVTLTPPVGVQLYDTDDGKIYVGDGESVGGRSLTARSAVRKVEFPAAASGLAACSATTDKITWTTYGAYLRTGDSVFLTSGTTGLMPSGLNGASGTYFVIKDSDSPTSTSFKVATSRANALAGTAVDLITNNLPLSGVSGFNISITDIAVQGVEDVLFVATVAAAGQITVPGPKADFAPQFTIKRAIDGAFAVTVAALTSGGVAAGPSGLWIDGISGNLTLTSGLSLAAASGYGAVGITLIGDPSVTNKCSYFTVGRNGKAFA